MQQKLHKDLPLRLRSQKSGIQLGSNPERHVREDDERKGCFLWIGRDTSSGYLKRSGASSQRNNTNGTLRALGSKAFWRQGCFAPLSSRSVWSSCQCSAFPMIHLYVHVSLAAPITNQPDDPYSEIRLAH